MGTLSHWSVLLPQHTQNFSSILAKRRQRIVVALPNLFFFFAEYVLYLSRLFRQYSLHFMATLNNKPVILNPRREVIVTHLHNHTCKKCLAMSSPTFEEGENFLTYKILILRLRHYYLKLEHLSLKHSSMGGMHG